MGGREGKEGRGTKRNADRRVSLSKYRPIKSSRIGSSKATAAGPGIVGGKLSRRSRHACYTLQKIRNETTNDDPTTDFAPSPPLFRLSHAICLCSLTSFISHLAHLAPHSRSLDFYPFCSLVFALYIVFLCFFVLSPIPFFPLRRHTSLFLTLVYFGSLLLLLHYLRLHLHPSLLS